MPAKLAASGSASGETRLADVSNSTTALRSGSSSSAASACEMRPALSAWPATMRRLLGSVSVLEPELSMTITIRRPVHDLSGSSRVIAQIMRLPLVAP